MDTIAEVAGEYFQETFNIVAVLSIAKELGGNREQTKVDIRAIPEVLTVVTVEPHEGGIQRDVGGKYVTTLKVNCRQPQAHMGQRTVARLILKDIQKITGVTVIRYDLPSSTLAENEEGYQNSPTRKAANRRGSERILRRGPNDTGPFKLQPLDPDWEQAPPGAAGGLEEAKINILIRGAVEDILESFKIRDVLNPEIWDGDKMREDIRGRLETIASEFIDNLELYKMEVKDIILTGSLANYTWSSYSDLDVHIIVDFRDVSEDEGLTKKYFDSVRSNWNKSHSIQVKGFDVELYIQDDDEEHVATGVYSILRDEWVVVPEPEESIVDLTNVMKKARPLMRDINRVEVLFGRGEFERLALESRRLKDKIHRMRKAGLEDEGIFSVENLAFKVLRRGGHLKRLFDTARAAYDASMTMMDQ